MPDIGEEVFRFASSRLRKKVGRGECWDLPFQALKAAGAKTPHDLGNDLYVWGTEIPLSDVRDRKSVV